MNPITRRRFLKIGVGLALRSVIVYAGQYSYWANAHGLPLPF